MAGTAAGEMAASGSQAGGYGMSGGMTPDGVAPGMAEGWNADQVGLVLRAGRGQTRAAKAQHRASLILPASRAPQP